mmetsp:Transcript_28959/g.48207  ORF Transcript_28959/g.48207 Transcript_28959/m.48207 type:complete len:138 (-) Transcript_28959:2251-2664(-)
MVKGRKGLYLEAWKFSVYISIPIIASVYHSNPETQKYWADYWKFITYPENPNTNVKQKIQELAKEKEEKREQHLAYQRQLQELQRAAERSSSFSSNNVHNDETTPAGAGKKSWWKSVGGWFSRSSDKKQDASSSASL